MNRSVTLMSRVRGVVAAVVMGSALALPGVAQAQFRGGMGGDLFNPPVSDSELDKIVELLGLDESVAELADSMLDAMDTDWEKQRDEMRDIMRDAREEFQETRDFTVWEDLRPIMEEFGKKREAMEASFLSDLKLLLDEDQTEEWPRVERMLLRQRSLRDGLLSGEAVDLVEISNDLELESDSKEALRPVLDQYEVEMHRALEHRNEVFEDGMSQGMSLFQNQDFETIDKLFAKATEASERVRDTNARYARQMIQLLPEGDQAAFEERYQRESFPRVYRDAWVVSAVESAETFDDLTVDQRERVTEMRTAYERDARPLNERWAEAIRESESKRTFQDMFGGGRDSESTREAREARQSLDQRYEEQLKSILTEDQVSRLPEQDRRDFRERGRERFQRGDRGDRGDRQGGPGGPGGRRGGGDGDV
ncbi:MAG: hypothetical protein KDA21_04415 [Phycisphaerales bacterium]|nr:hypothetical protein [Phycisphaerales bacterium]